jgi:hypothetical protein
MMLGRCESVYRRCRIDGVRRQLAIDSTVQQVIQGQEIKHTAKTT